MAQHISSIADFKMEVNQSFVDKGVELEPKFIETKSEPIQLVELEKDRDNNWMLSKHSSFELKQTESLGKGEAVCFDFGNHQVGYVSFKIKPIGSPPDAPAHLRIKFGETLCEIGEDSKDYEGWLSSSWIQEEFMHIDVLPAVINMPRRYAFRYMEIKVLDTSPKYQLIFEEIRCRTVSSADMSNVAPLSSNVDEDLIKMDRVALKTLHDCMQSVFEDGPKRDRRLWIGDLRLQASANYFTFKNYDLVKRCLYLFAGLTQNEGRVGACLFIEPHMLVDDTALLDYSLFFISCLHDYYEATRDRAILEELWPVAYKQAVLSLRELDEAGVVKDREGFWAFIDWHKDLNKQGAVQGVLIYTLKQASKMAEELGCLEEVQLLDTYIKQASKGTLQKLWDEEQGFFISGKDRQISWATQVWMVLADVLEQQENEALLDRLFEKNPKINMVTPYMNHHLVEALILNGRKEKALEIMKSYWGEMIKDGADCFWELYNPEDKKESPYGSNIINSYCHAWSCTPTYFIRKYFI
ncbi:alpha-L-rhamnosidase-related protein [Cellulosilyticum sp. I15G10I2]|uniref:alpha-L-rhamnosidase-related protein n=1 Tax=Cellulosilyticum sp. I15G10I2 TaxID=1892843 RepID=UPI00085C4E1F|nr:family 78 glycoside hydrolase catalytic domain [Cellulosilyticum sp. I15G10I2]